jgi:protein TonB
LVRLGGEWFPESQGRLDDVIAGCRQVARPPSSALPEVTEARAALPTLPALPAPPSKPALVEKPQEPRAAEKDTRLASVGPAPVVAPAPTPTPAPAPAPALAKPQVVPLTAIESQMIAGEREIHLPPDILPALKNRGIKQAVIMIKLCIDDGGQVTSADVTKSCGYAEADQAVARKLREWKFRPYMVNGQRLAVCSMKLFRYIIE